MCGSTYLSAFLGSTSQYKMQQHMYLVELISETIFSIILASLNWLPLKFRIAFKILVLTNKAIHGHQPFYLKDYIVSYGPSKTLHSHDAGLLVILKKIQK